MSDPEISNILKNISKKNRGEGYTAIPFADCYEELKVIEWLQAHKLEIPSQRPSGRNPTPIEVRNCLKREFMVVSYDMPLGGSWTARVHEMIKGANDDTRYRLMLVHGSDYTYEDKPVSLSFGGNSDLIHSFLEKLAALCGPFVLMLDGELQEIIGLNSYQGGKL